MAEDQADLLRETVRGAGAIWWYSCDGAGAAELGATETPPDARFRWLHLNLADQRALRWLEREAELPASVHAMMLAAAAQPGYVIDQGVLGLVLHDYERDFDSASTGRLAGLHVALTPRAIVTGRYRPLHSGDLFRQRLEQGPAVEDPVAALELLLATITESHGLLVLDLATSLLETEEELLAHDEAPDTRELISIRRRSAQLHRLIGGLRATLQRVERDSQAPLNLLPAVRQGQGPLFQLENDIVTAQNQLKLLRDELDLQAAQRTNANLYLLSILTAIMMPATLVTGFFGMNTGGLPFAQHESGTLMATLVAIGTGMLTWLLLRVLGLVKSR
jgi:zinc transporter